MAILDELRAVLEARPLPDFDPFEFLALCMAKFDEGCSHNEEFDPREIDKAVNTCNTFGGIAVWFLENGFPFAAESLLIYAWNKFAQIQLSEGKRVYRAGIAYYLSKVYQKLEDKGAALRWALYVQADDMLGEHPRGGGNGRQALLTIHRISNSALSDFNLVATQNLEILRSQYEDNWSNPSAFAEDVVRKFALAKREFAHLFAIPTSLNEFPLCPAYFSLLLQRLDSPHANTTDQGNALEELASYLFLLIPGWVPRKNVIDEQLAYETDLVIRNLNVAGNLTAELLGRHFFVECKNWGTPVGVRDVGYFLYRMKLTHARFGVLFAPNKISGSSANGEEKAAFQLLRKAFHEDGSICVVLNSNDLNELLNGVTTFWSILLEKIERLRFGTQR